MTGAGGLTLSEACVGVLQTADPPAKAAAAQAMAAGWRDGVIAEIGDQAPPARPARPFRPALRPPRDMARRGKAATLAGRIALLHALAHIELNAIDLACDLIARFRAGDLPRRFHDDWVRVADEEALHYTLLAGRLAALDTAYGDLPAHDGLWQVAEETADDLLARLAIVPLVLEARGLDVTPAIIANLERAGDDQSAAILTRILADEIGHVAVGRHWFSHFCAERGLQPDAAYRELVRSRFKGRIKPPFNEAARGAAGLDADWYRPLVDD